MELKESFSPQYKICQQTGLCTKHEFLLLHLTAGQIFGNLSFLGAIFKYIYYFLSSQLIFKQLRRLRIWRIKYQIA